ncbi:glutathione S-transferase theta-1a [Dunckerocampus dactyliophorus]|uniref:glutathione S-transferase theta-1a n=1 Tax=Dunckerocampus dactyliophorus TaxID=161453 RepID=UPI002405C555|nr:glutathione S-transferase theta-1a [Dunckerocampus dactyliophorus]
MELYLDLRSQPCRSLFLFAKAANIPFNFKLIDLSQGQQYSEEFVKLSPVKKVPVMKDGDFVLTESVAILQYLVQKHASSLPDHWYPADLRQRARVNEYLSWQHMNLRAHGSKVFLLKTMYSIIMGQEVPKEKLDDAVDDLNQSLELLEQKFLQNRAFIVGEQISLADLVAYAEILQPVGSGLDVFAGRPKLAAWRDGIKVALGAALLDEVNEAIMAFGSQSQDLQNSEGMKLFKPKFMKMFS